MKHKFGIFFSVCGLLLNILASVVYNWKIFKGVAHPNTASWAVWSFMVILNFTSYSVMSKDLVKSIFPTVSGILCIITFILTLFQGQWKLLGWGDLSALTVGLVASFLWWRLKRSGHNKASMIANLMLQVGITVGFIPTIQDVWVHPQSENSFCWFLWTVSFLFQTVVVILRWKGQKQDLVYPVNCTCLHLAVGLIAQFGK